MHTVLCFYNYQKRLIYSSCSYLAHLEIQDVVDIVRLSFKCIGRL